MDVGMYILLGLVAALVAIGTVTATGVLMGTLLPALWRMGRWALAREDAFFGAIADGTSRAHERRRLQRE